MATDMNEQFENSFNETTRQVEPTEFVDLVGSDEAKRLIGEAIDQFAATSRQESWGRRRERVLRLARILEQRLDYDLEHLPSAK